MALSRNAIRCVLCHGAVSIRSGNLEKIRLHMEVDHDCFFEQDIIIALNFLEEFERQEIIEKVLPRMKVILENVKKYSGTESENTSNYLDKRLFEDVDVGAVSEGIYKKVKLVDSNLVNNNAECIKEVADSNDLCFDLEISSDDDNLEIVTDEEGEEGVEYAEKSPKNLQEQGQAIITTTESTSDNTTHKHVLKAQAKAIADTDKSILNFGDNKKIKCNVSPVPEANHLEEVEAKALASIGINVTPATSTQLDDTLPNGIQKTAIDDSTYAVCEYCSRKYKKGSINKHRARCMKQYLEEGNAINPYPFPLSLEGGSPVAYSSPKTSSSQSIAPSNNPSGSISKLANCLICDKSILRGNMKRHMKVMHSNDHDQLSKSTKVQIQCKLCSAVAGDEDELRKHISDVHFLDFDDVGVMVNDDSKSAIKGRVKLDFTPSIIADSNPTPKSVQTKSRKANERNEMGRLPCPYCPKDFTMKSARCRHVKKCHSDLREAYKNKQRKK